MIDMGAIGRQTRRKTAIRAGTESAQRKKAQRKKAQRKKRGASNVPKSLWLCWMARGKAYHPADLR